MEKPICPNCSGTLRYLDPRGQYWIIQWVDTDLEDIGLVKQGEKVFAKYKYKDCLICAKCKSYFDLKLKRMK